MSSQAVPVAAPPPVLQTYTYRIIQGQHEERSPDGSPRLYRRGDTFESIQPRLADVWPEKFQRIHASVHNPNLETWNPEAETLEAFNARMLTKHPQAGAQIQQTAAPVTNGGAVADPPPTVPNGGAKKNHSRLEQMSLKDLQSLAAEDEVDLKGAKTRDEVLRILKGVYS